MTDHPDPTDRDATPRPADDVVRLDIPAGARHVATARVVAASMAAAAGWSVDDIEDVRLALDELLAVLVEAADDGDRIQLALRIDERGGIEADASVVGAGPAPVATVDELSQRIIAAVTDEYEVGPGTFWLAKAPALR